MRPLVAPLVALGLLVARPVRAEPWFGWGQGATEEKYANGDVDAEDLLTEGGTGSPRVGAAVRPGTWVSLGGFFRVLGGGYDDGGLMVMAGIAFDKLGLGSPRESPSVGPGSAKAGAPRASEPPAPAPSPPTPPEPSSALPSTDDDAARPVVTPTVARLAVKAAWRTSGLGSDDARIDSMVARARASAALPEARFRAMRVFLLDGSESTVVPIDTSSYETAGATLVLEGRLTWRLDRLLYADDEPSLERLRLERQDARSKVAGRVLDALFQWQRARASIALAKPGSREANDATIRLIEAAAGLDVMTGGWFCAWTAEVREE